MFSNIKFSTYKLYINILHICNDGFQASYLLLLPFIALDLRLSIAQVGILGSLFKISSIVFALPAGTIARKFGGLKTLLLASLLYGVGYIVTGITPTFSFLFIVTLITGIGFGLFHPIGFGLIANATEKEKMGRVMGNFTATGDIGKIVLSAGITFIITLIGWRMTSITYGVITLLTFFLLKIFLKEVATEELRQEVLHTSTKFLFSYFKNKHFVAISIAGMLDGFASSPFFLFLPFLLLKKGVEPVFLGSFTAIYLLGNFAGKTILGRITDKLGSTKTFIFSEIGNVLFIFLLLLPFSQFLIIVISFLLGALTKGTSPVLATLVTESLSLDDNYQQAFAVNTFILNLSTVIAPLTLGIISNIYGLSAAFYLMAFMTFLATLPILGFSVIKERRLSKMVVAKLEEDEIISQ